MRGWKLLLLSGTLWVLISGIDFNLCVSNIMFPSYLLKRLEFMIRRAPPLRNETFLIHGTCPRIHYLALNIRCELWPNDWSSQVYHCLLNFIRIFRLYLYRVMPWMKIALLKPNAILGLEMISIYISHKWLVTRVDSTSIIIIFLLISFLQLCLIRPLTTL
jgi:hypothetical protein